MELFFLCTIALALVSFISMALAQPPVAVVTNKETNVSPESTKETANSKETSIIEFQRETTERELISLVTA